MHLLAVGLEATAKAGIKKTNYLLFCNDCQWLLRCRID